MCAVLWYRRRPLTVARVLALISIFLGVWCIGVWGERWRASLEYVYISISLRNGNRYTLLSLRWNRQCVRVLMKRACLGESYFFLLCAWCVCAYDLYNCIIWNNRVFSPVGCVVVWLIYIFFYIVVCINVYVFTLMLVCGSSESPCVSLRFFLYCLSSQTGTVVVAATDWCRRPIPYTDKNINFAVE
jgi:hypothetical protein